MDRRHFVTGSLGIASAFALAGPALAARHPDSSDSPTASGLPRLGLTLTDTGFAFDQVLTAGRFEITVTNDGTMTDSHFGLGRIPDRITEGQYFTWLAAQGEDTEDLTWDDIAFVGVPDWPPPGGSVSGVIDIESGRYFLFDPFSGRQIQTYLVEGDLAPEAEPDADLTVTLKDMTIDLPAAAFTTDRLRWKIENTGAMSHEIAVVPVSDDFTEEHLQMLFELPEDATPPPGVPDLVYQPVAAIGILAKGHTSWLDVELAPGRYLGVCMLPFGTGYPHAIDGMYLFFDVE